MVTVFTTKTCAPCATVKRYLDSKKVEYTVVDVTDNPKKRQELYDLTKAMIVPVITKGDKFVVGPNIAALRRLISE